MTTPTSPSDLSAAPSGIDVHAPVVARHDITIAAPLDGVWRLHTDVDAWPRWQSDITVAQIEGPFAPGSSFAWQTYGLDVESRIHRVDAAGDDERRTLWGGPVRGILGLHAWTFTATEEGVHVFTEESWSGAPVEADAGNLQSALYGSLVAWLAHLKVAAERMQEGVPRGTGTV